MSAKRFVSVNQLVERMEPLLNGAKILNVYFDDFVKDKFYSSKYNIKPIAFKITTTNKQIKDIEYKDYIKLLPDMEYINVSGNATKDISKLSLTKQLNRLCIALDKVCFKAPDGRDVFYYKSSLQPANQSKYKSMLKKLSDDKVAYINQMVENNNNFDEYKDYMIESDDEDIPPDAL